MGKCVFARREYEGFSEHCRYNVTLIDAKLLYECDAINQLYRLNIQSGRFTVLTSDLFAIGFILENLLGNCFYFLKKHFSSSAVITSNQ